MTIVLILLLLFPSFVEASVLSDAAAALAPGQWTVIVPTDSPDVFNQPVSAFTTKMTWDPITKSIFLIGDNTHCVVEVFVKYDEASNSWITQNFNASNPAKPATAVSPYPGPQCTGSTWPTAFSGHPFGHSTMVADHGWFYTQTETATAAVSFYTGVTFSSWGALEWVFNIRQQLWQALAINAAQRALGESGANDAGSTSVYFPEQDAVFYFDNNGRIWRFDLNKLAWDPAAFATTWPGGATGSTWSFSEYNPVFHAVYWGTNPDATHIHLFRLDVDGSTHDLGLSPAGPTTYNGTGYNGNFVTDPVTGDIIIYTPWGDGSGTYTNPNVCIYHPGTNIWDPCVSNPFPTIHLGPPGWDLLYGFVMSTPIPEYGVTATMFCGGVGTNTPPWGNRNCAGGILLYKNANQPTITADQDFANRCSAAGVVSCWGFDNTTTQIVRCTAFTGATPPDCSGGGVPYNTSPGIYSTDGGVTWISNNWPQLDTTVKKSGAGSMRFDWPASINCSPTCPRPAGKWEPYLPSGATAAYSGSSFVENSTYYLQFAMRMSAGMVNNNFPDHLKFHETLAGQSTCGNGGVWLFEGGSSAFKNGIIGYTACGNNFMTTDSSLVNNVYPGNSPPYWQQQGYYDDCAYATFNFCFTMPANTWVTFTFKIHIGTYNTASTSIEGWVKQDGWTNERKFLNIDNFTWDITSGMTNAWFGPYLTNLVSMSGNADAHLWIDEFIVSTQVIQQPITNAASPGSPFIITIGTGKTLSAGSGKTITTGLQ